MIKLEDYDLLPNVKVDGAVWQKLQNEYYQHFKDIGTSGFYFGKYLDLQIAIRDEAIFACDQYNPNLSRAIVNRKQLEKELAEVPTGNQTLEDQAIQFEIFFNRSFDTKLISTYRWYKYIE
ncbi:MAG: hypothetical protein DRQ47_10160, partial [Gammaproteobacteria bacterium]